MSTWSIRLHIIGDILIILVHGKASRVCNIHTRLSSKLFRSVLWVEYGCAILLTATLPFTEGPLEKWTRMEMATLAGFSVTSITVSAIAPKVTNLVASLAALLISSVTWSHSKVVSRTAPVSFHCLAQIRIL